jgi:hypothetical protein
MICALIRGTEDAMAYCRFSSDNFNCDVHCSAEECEDGSTVWVTHLAAHRRIGGRKEPLDLPHAGESYEDASAAACLARLRELRRMGYRFPDRALQRLEEDAAGAAPEMPAEIDFSTGERGKFFLGDIDQIARQLSRTHDPAKR